MFLYPSPATWLSLLLNIVLVAPAFSGEPANFRKPANGAGLGYWLQNMAWYHRYSREEIMAAMGLGAKEVE